VAECVINWSPLDPALDIDASAAAASFPSAFERHFPVASAAARPSANYIRNSEAGHETEGLGGKRFLKSFPCPDSASWQD